MIKKPSYLKLNRLVITKAGKQLYDEKFHDGINIIRGEHSVGKSTILDMIFYVLGGELKKDDWKYPADECSNVNAEITINDRIITLTRPVDPSGAVPHIKIYEGEYEKAMKDADGWLDYGSRRSNERLSFSEMMFELFDWGQYKSDSYQNLTMHQIMRLIYLSQSSDSNRIFRKESTRSDNENTRTAIAEFLFGLDDLETHSVRQNLLKYERDYENTGTELRAYFELLGNDASLTVEIINELLNEKYIELSEIDSQKEILLRSTDNIDSNNEYNLAIERNDILLKIQLLTNKISFNNNELSSNKTEIQDCLLFGQNLVYRLKSLNESQETYKGLGRISFEYCPCCLTPISEHDKTDNDSGCALCKSTVNNFSLEEKYIESLNELQYQQRQNDKIIEKLYGSAEYIESYIQELRKELESLQNRLFEINSLQDKIDSIAKVDDLKLKREDIAKQMESCRSRIAALEAKSQHRKEYVYSKLSEFSTFILEGDSGNEELFKTATQLSSEIDFAKDRWLLNERVNYSDSSNVVKKAALHLAFLIFSIVDSACRYPRFSIMDFECGDINEARSHNLQKLITTSLSNSKGFQLIMTTSKIDSSLNNNTYGVGRYYDKNDYILKI